LGVFPIAFTFLLLFDSLALSPQQILYHFTMAPAIHLQRAPLQRFLLLSLLAFYVDISTTATIPTGQSLTAPVNSASSTIALHNEEEHYYCSRQEEFLTHAFEGKDCLVAIEKMRHVEETEHKKHLFEFREAPSHHEYPYETEKMPRKYVSGRFCWRRTPAKVFVLVD